MSAPRFPDWPHLYREGAADHPVLLMLHGTGSNEQDIAALAAELDPAAAVLAPRGRVPESGMLRWFARRGEGVFDVDDVILRAGELAGFVADAREHYGLGDRMLIAVGFSNGANIALATAMLHPETVDRVISFSGMYPFGDRALEGTLSGSRFLVLNGRSDPMAPLPSVTTLVAELQRRGADVGQILRDGGHGVDRSDLEAAVDWLKRRP
ncbi:phospholipase/carboxylesterase [Arthrobacter subterraneus]|uniref:Phospholipase/carboxylesterase n=1 Tax=Arthrobacter subterraneus TaxID=335973 RepID=A0A1G8N079_9MICC|nr:MULTISPECIES: alpha/beta hydrolase [Arthrobacter]SDI73629.1 phospholipase/carboxylesterase [Arthrobacter subterraneus]